MFPPPSARRHRLKRIGNAAVSIPTPQSRSAQDLGNVVPQGAIHALAVGSPERVRDAVGQDMVPMRWRRGQRVPATTECRPNFLLTPLLPAIYVIGLAYPIGALAGLPATNCELAARASAGRSPGIPARVSKKVLTRCRQELKLWDVGVDEGESCGRESVPRQEHSLFLFLRRPRPSSCIHS